MCGIIGVILGNADSSPKDYDIPVLPDEKLLENKKFSELQNHLKNQFEISYNLVNFQCLKKYFRDFKNKNNQIFDSIQKSYDGFENLSGEIKSYLKNNEISLSLTESETLNACMILCKDISWLIKNDFLENLHKIADLADDITEDEFSTYWKLNVIMNNLDRLEIRGRDSAGLVTLFPDFNLPENCEFSDNFISRKNVKDFVNNSIIETSSPKSLTFVHKVAEEIGPLGQNVKTLRKHFKNDDIFKYVSKNSTENTMICHTRWASNGIINEQNCHPLDNSSVGSEPESLIFAALNGDIDNYIELKNNLSSRSGINISRNVTTDAKIIPLVIDDHLKNSSSFEEAFIKAVNDFKGSTAIVSVSNKEPDKIYLALKGSGQSLYIGLADDVFIYASETYGVVEHTRNFIKMNGETVNNPDNPNSQGQIFILDKKKAGTLEGIKAIAYDGSIITLTEEDIKTLEITTRDIDRGGYTHFLHKEISESPHSVEKTLLGRFVTKDENGAQKPVFTYDESAVPVSLQEKLKTGKIRRILLTGQGTAAVAGDGIAYIMREFLVDKFEITTYKASELSGFHLRGNMEDTLVVAVSQSGTTTDTNRTVDLLRKRGAMVLGIVNRRNSDLVYKADGIIYTSDGRDVEMAVASTKAFYCQVVAGYILSLYIANLTELISPAETVEELSLLSALPQMMNEVLNIAPDIEKAAAEFAVKKRYWATVGNGSNKVASDEVRIKLSELCYKSIATDYTEDKKHIDLSSEPLILVFAAGLSGPNLSDVMKEVAIFKSHNAFPIAIISKGESQLDAYASAVFEVPTAPETMAFLLSTMVGHLFGYYAAVAIDNSIKPLREARATIVKLLHEHELSDPRLANKLSYQLEVPRRKYMDNLEAGLLNTSLEVDTAGELLVLFNRLVLGRHERRDSKSELSAHPVESFMTVATRAIGEAARPIDAIKHQAKTVTVGISREDELPQGVLFEPMEKIGFSANQLSFGVLNMIQGISGAIDEVLGYTIYKVQNLDPLGQPNDNTTIEIIERAGVSKQIKSRTDKSSILKGTKREVIAKGNLFFGLGGADQRAIVIIPVMEKGVRRYLLLTHIKFKSPMPIEDKINVLKFYDDIYDRIRTDVTEVITDWNDSMLDKIPIEECLSDSPSDIAKSIISGLKQ